MNLNTSQQAAIKEIDNNLQIIACAGSGKTEVITRRIINILNSRVDVNPESIVAFTFTEKAAENMRSRIERNGNGQNYGNRMYVGTIHGFCRKLLGLCDAGFDQFRILDTVKAHLFASRYHAECGMDLLGLKADSDARLFASCIEKMIDDYDNRQHWSQGAQDAFSAYRDCLFSHSYIDFGMLIHESLQQLELNRTAQDYIKSIRYLIVDEYQDVDDLQEKLIKKIASYGANVCVVGDDDQTIYQFRGSNANNMIAFSKNYDAVRQIKMETNYRSAKEIVDVADKVISHNDNRLSKRMKSADAEKKGYLSVKDFTDTSEEYDAIASEVIKLHDSGQSYSSIAILIRKRNVLAELCKALERKNIPYHADSTDSFFEGRNIKAYLSLLTYLKDQDRGELYEGWKALISDEQFMNGFRILKREARTGGDATQKPLSQILDEFVINTGFVDMESSDESHKLRDKDCFNKILNDIDEIFFDQQFSARIAKALSFIERDAQDEYRSFDVEETDEDAVQIMTVHKSKGLEFDCVFVPDLEKGIFPARNVGGRQYWHVLGEPFTENKDKYNGTIDDERKLFYVAATRAKNKLYLFFETSKKVVSTFVIEACESEYISYDIDRILSIQNVTKEQVKGIDDNRQPERRLDKKALKSAILDHYGAAGHFFPAARADFHRVLKLWDDDDLIREARKANISVENYYRLF